MRLRRRIRIALTEERVASLLPAGRAGSCAGVEAEAVARDEIAAAWCPRCAAEAAMLTPERAAEQACVSTRQIFRWLEADLLHFVETGGTWPLVCGPSLSALARREMSTAVAVELNGEQGR